MSEKRELPPGPGDGGHGFNKRIKTDTSLGEGSPGISKVLHVRNVSPETSHEELVAFVSQFGSVVAICFLSKFQQALVEMESPQAASAVIMYSKQTPVFIRGKEIHFEYSKSPSINTNATPKTNTNPASIHHILLCTILNPIYNITVDVIYAIMSPYGNVLRIVVFNKNGVQSLNAYSAVQAYTALDGKDIYAGSCTLKIEFSRAEKLNVHVNNDKSRDYTNPHLPGVAPAPTQPPPPPPPAPYYHHQSNAGYPPSGQPYYPPPQHTMPGMPPMGAQAAPNAVLIVYGLEDPLMNVDRVFNLFCLFGNVSKIKIITHKKGSALVHMENAEMADRAMNSLNGAMAFGHQLTVQYSKHQYIAESRNDIEASAIGANQNTKDFTTSTLNRFRANPNAFRHIYKPSATLHFANAPREFSEQDFAHLFTSLGVKPQVNFKFFSQYNNAHNYNNPNQMNQANDERRYGLLEWADIPSAVEALVVANNQKIGTNVLRLSFTANAIIHNNERKVGGQPSPSPSLSPSPSFSSAPPSSSPSPAGVPPPPPASSPSPSSDSTLPPSTSSVPPPPPSSAPPAPAPPSPSPSSSPAAPPSSLSSSSPPSPPPATSTTTASPPPPPSSSESSSPSSAPLSPAPPSPPRSPSPPLN